MPDSSSKTATAEPTVAVVKKTAPTQTPPKMLPPYKVLLHNDDVNEMVFVVQSIVEVVPMPAEKAFTVMVGNAGLPPGYDPGRFVYEKLMALRPGGCSAQGPERDDRRRRGAAELNHAIKENPGRSA